jgi:hypothetical protein
MFPVSSRQCLSEKATPGRTKAAYHLPPECPQNRRQNLPRQAQICFILGSLNNVDFMLQTRQRWPPADSNICKKLSAIKMLKRPS